jgi:hypothetical protein
MTAPEHQLNTWQTPTGAGTLYGGRVVGGGELEVGLFLTSNFLF